MMCKTARQFHATVSGMTEEGQKDGFLRTRKMVERIDGTVVDGEWLVNVFIDILHILMHIHRTPLTLIQLFHLRALP